MKKIIINIIALISALLMLSVTAAAALPFSDVSEDAWYYSDVRTAYRSGLINGKSATKFAPEANLTYAEAVKLAACLNQFFDEGSVTLENGDPWYQSYVDYCRDRGIIDRDYNWSENATRGGYMEIFARALSEDVLNPINEIHDGAIPDVSADHPQAEGIYKLYRAGILQGSDSETHACNPDLGIRRSEVSAILARILDPDRRIRFEMLVDIPFEIVEEPASVYAEEERGKAVFTVDAAGNDLRYDWQMYSAREGAWVSVGNAPVLTVEYDVSWGMPLSLYRCRISDGEESKTTEAVSVYPPVTFVEVVEVPADKQRFISVLVSYTDMGLRGARELAEAGEPCAIILKDSSKVEEMVEELLLIGGEAAVRVARSEGLKFLWLVDVGEDRVGVIRTIDGHTGCGLTEAQNLVKSKYTVIGRFMTGGEAKALADALTALGASVMIK